MAEGVVDLFSGDGGATAGDDEEAVDGGCIGDGGSGRQEAEGFPVCEEGVFDTGGAGDEWGGLAGFPEGATDFGKAGGVEGIEENDVVALSGELLEAFETTAGLERQDIDETDGKGRLAGEMAAEVSFVHGCDGVAGHGGMTVDAMGFAVDGGEEVTEGDVTAEGGGTDDERDGVGSKAVATEFDGFSDVAVARRAIEGGAGFVVAEGGAESLEGGEDRGEMMFHP